jgi:hypothetical protein
VLTVCCSVSASQVEDKFLAMDSRDGKVVAAILEMVKELKRENEALRKDNEIFKDKIMGFSEKNNKI